jgi:hypothetical protein
MVFIKMVVKQCYSMLHSSQLRHAFRPCQSSLKLAAACAACFRLQGVTILVAPGASIDAWGVENDMSALEGCLQLQFNGIWSVSMSNFPFLRVLMQFNFFSTRVGALKRVSMRIFTKDTARF